MDSLTTATLLPPVLRDARGHAFAAALDMSLDIDTWLACPLAIEHAPDEVLWELARQFDVAGPLCQAMRTRERKERLVRNALRLQRKRGTPWSVEEVMRLLGFSDAEVIDRITALKYDGAAVHNGAYNFEADFNRVFVKYNGRIIHDGECVFSGEYRLDFENWRGYMIRLYMDDASRALGDTDREQATQIARDWAPLRSVLVGFYARHIIRAAVVDPAYEIARVYRVFLVDAKGNRQSSPHVWCEYFENNACAVRWRMSADDLRLSDVSGVILADRGNNELRVRSGLPIVRAAPNVTCEGVWYMDKETQ
ncbi:MAG: phage tail protein [Holophagales bacterium]|jgi:biotin operon repressor|nr:phage tail protein [Holophagales bacterium]